VKNKHEHINLADRQVGNLTGKQIWVN